MNVMQEIHRFEDIDEKIETFLRGKMSPAEAAAFKRELQEDKELRARAKTVAFLIKTMKGASASRDKRVVDEIKGVKPRIISFNYKIITSVAACLCLIFSVSDYLVRKSNTKELAASYSSQIEWLSTGKTKGIDNPDAAKNISEVLKIADLDERITQLKSMYDKASSAVFNELTNHHEEIGFYLVISYLENNDRSEAKELLEQLLEQYSDNALFNQMLNDIDNIKGLF
jgi:hypothetical protein